MSTFPDLLARRLREDAGRPFVTYYDDRTGERTELSVTTFANWVAKTANLLVDELMLDPGDTLAVRLPPHWLGPVFLGAAWSAGLTVTGRQEPGPAALVVIGPGRQAPGEEGAELLVCSLTPFAGRVEEPLPQDAHDFGVLWPGQGDVFVPTAPAELPDAAPRNDRVLTDLDPTAAPGRALLVELLAGAGSLVLVGSAMSAERWEQLAVAERADVTER